MKYIPRLAEARLHRLARRFPVVIVFGARQAGKSTLLGHVLGAGVRTFVFDPNVDVANARQDPELFLRLNPPPLLLDEVQYAPEVLGPLKRLADERRGEYGLYFLTGSQQLGVLRAVHESLAGRAGLLDLLPMSQRELLAVQPLRPGLLDTLFEAPDTDALLEALRARSRVAAPPVNERVFRGGYPGRIPFETDEVADWFSAYLRTYIERDVRLLRQVADPHDFTRFVRLIAALTAQEMNASHLGREIGLAPRTARAWMDVLVQSFQVHLLDAWSGNATKRIIGRPKMLFSDTGFAAWLTAITSPVALAGHPSFGPLFETYVATDLIKQAAPLATPPRFWHWRTAAGAEVDLVLERDGVFHLVEVKLTARPSRRDARGMKAFAETYPRLRIGHRLVVHAGPDLERLDEHTLAVPVDLL